MTIVENPTITVTGGVDTHLEFHVAAAVDANGGVLGVETFDVTTGGYRRLVAWLGTCLGSSTAAPRFAARHRSRHLA